MFKLFITININISDTESQLTHTCNTLNELSCILKFYINTFRYTAKISAKYATYYPMPYSTSPNEYIGKNEDRSDRYCDVEEIDLDEFILCDHSIRNMLLTPILQNENK